VAPAALVPKDWHGDYEALTGLEQCFLSKYDLCEQTFASKQEAFTAGWLLGLEMTRADRPELEIAESHQA